MSTHIDLPEDIWKLVLQHVPFKQRLSALVCQKFKAAAVAATDSIEATLVNQPEVDNLTTYLQQHGIHLTRLVLNGECTDEDSDLNWPKCQHIPCQRLQELHLTSFDFGWGPDEDRPSMLDGATAITRLEILDAHLYLPAVSVLPSLQNLCIAEATSRFDSKDGTSKASAFQFSGLQQLTYLGLSALKLQAPTDLGFSGQNLDASLCHISSITGLHTLHIKDCAELMSVTPGLSLPPSLQHLELLYTGYGAFEPSVLAAATQLTHLDIEADDEGGVSDGVCWLEVLSKLQHLDYLRLSPLDSNWPPPSPAFQAWVASTSKLRVLHVDPCDLPDGALAHIFPSAPSSLVVLPRLEELLVSRIPPGTVAGVVRCCPALQQLTVGSAELGCTHLAALSQLSALTRLVVALEPEDDGGDGTSTAASMQSLAGLTRLQEFRATVPVSTGGRGTRWRDLMPLTALRQLTKLVPHCGLLSEVGDLETQAGQPPDVWLQLLERCAGDRACLPSIIQSYAQQQQDVSDLQQQLILTQKDNARLQQQVVDLQEQLAGQQQGQAQQQHHA